MALLNAIIALALFSTRSALILYSENLFSFSMGSSAPNNFPMPSVIPPTILPNPATAEPTPNAAMPSDNALIPKATSFSAFPSIS